MMHNFECAFHPEFIPIWYQKCQVFIYNSQIIIVSYLLFFFTGAYQLNLINSNKNGFEHSNNLFLLL